MLAPLAYFITFTTYGTWLHGRPDGSVDDANNQFGAPFIPADWIQEEERRTLMSQELYLMDEPKRKLVLQTILEVAAHRKWTVLAVPVRSNSVHIVAGAEAKPEKVMTDFKAWCSRRLKESFDESTDRKRWTEHGSTRYLWDETSVDAAVKYTLNGRGTPMQRFPSEPEA